MLEETGANCCYAKSDKYWVTDPQGVAWETFHSLGAIPVYGDDVRGWSPRAADFRGLAACSPFLYASVDELFFALVNLCIGPRGDC